jgi:limonene-1,2-epoxide hydrolase
VEEHEAVALFHGRRKAWLKEDLEAYLAFFDPGLEFQGPRGAPLVGIEPYRDLVRSSLAAVRPLSFDFHHIAVHEDNVLAEWTQSVELRAHGAELVWRGMSVCEIRNGLIVWWREYYDPAQLQRLSRSD